jgi:hypothetical protein
MKTKTRLFCLAVLLALGSLPALAAAPAAPVNARTVMLDGAPLSSPPQSGRVLAPTFQYDFPSRTLHMWVLTADEPNESLTNIKHAVSTDGINFTSTGNMSYAGSPWAGTPWGTQTGEPAMIYPKVAKWNGSYKLFLWTYNAQPGQGPWGDYNYNISVNDIGTDLNNLVVTHEGPIGPIGGGIPGQNAGAWGVVGNINYFENNFFLGRSDISELTPVTAPFSPPQTASTGPYRLNGSATQVMDMVHPLPAPLAPALNCFDAGSPTYYVHNDARVLANTDGTLGIVYSVRDCVSGARVIPQLYYAESADNGVGWGAPVGIFSGGPVTIDGVPTTGNFALADFFSASGTRSVYFSSTDSSGNVVVAGTGLPTIVASKTIVVTPTTPDWAFLTESNNPVTDPATGTFVTGPGTPPAGTGSVQLQTLTPEASELFYTQQFAGMRVDSIKGLQFSTFVVAGGSDLAFSFDVSADIRVASSPYQGRLVFSPGISGDTTVIPGVWQQWDAYTQRAWYASRAPINAVCPMSSPCTLEEVLAAFPNAGVMQQVNGVPAPGEMGFKLGNNHSTGTVAVDKFVMVRDGPPASLTSWTYDFEPVSPSPAAVVVTAGTPQSTPIDTPFAAPLSVQVTDAAGQYLSGVTVSFDLPASGASASFPGNAITSSVVTTSVNGGATSPALTANAIVGSYVATASAGPATPGSFALTNLTGAPASVVASGGSPQTAIFSTPFAAPLQATVTDAGGNPVPGVTVTFTLPGSGASATFTGGVLSVGVQTDASGIAVSPTLTANATVGSYVATGSVTGVATPANFNLQNVKAPPVLQSAASRKVQGTAGTFDLPLTLAP